jgi:hypothetical protein
MALGRFRPSTCTGCINETAACGSAFALIATEPPEQAVTAAASNAATSPTDSVRTDPQAPQPACPAGKAVAAAT